MSDNNKKIIDYDWARKRELANARMRKYRERKQIIAKQFNSMSRMENATDEIRKIKKQIEEDKLQKRKESARERSRRYREKKRFKTQKTVDHFIQESQITRPSDVSPPFVTRNLENEQIETIVVKDEKDEDSDCEIVGATPGHVDVPDYIDPKSLSTLLDEPTETLPPVIEKIVSKLSNDEEFDRECDKFYKANLEMDVENVQVDVVKVLASVPSIPQQVKTISLSAEIDDIRTTTDLPGICSLCEDSSDHVQLLLIHLRDGHQLKQGLFVCPFCDYTSIKYEVVMKHTTKVHKLVSEQHKCEQCDYKTFRGDLYNRHLNQHLKEKIYSCDHCNYKTINVINFKRHLTSKHTKETEYKCQFCDFKSTNQGVVKRHETAKHTSQKDFSCHKCSYRTTLAHTLKRHQERYCKNRTKDSKAFTYVCIHCNFKTEDLNALEDHTLLTHPKKEILFCNLCEFSTTESAELTEHARTHLKDEPIDSEN